MPCKMTNEEYLHRIGELDLDIQILSEYTNSHDRIKCKCNKCGNEWSPLAYSLMNGHGCKKCAQEEVGRNKRKSQNDFEEKLFRINPDIKVQSQYNGLKGKVRFKCSKCNHEWVTVPDSVLYGKGCPKCSKVHKRTHDEFVAEMKEINPNLEFLTDFEKIHSKIKCRCKKCNNGRSASQLINWNWMSRM